MKRISIDLSEPFETVLRQALSLPAGGDDGGIGDAQIAVAMRSLHGAANGRAVATPIGSIPIAPAVAPWLKAVPLAVRTRRELLLLAGLSSDFNANSSGSETGKL